MTRNLHKIDKTLPNFPIDYHPQVIEFFDQNGLLLSQTPLGQVDYPRPENHQAEYLAIYFDGELGFFSEAKKILLNRLDDLAQGLTVISQVAPLRSNPVHGPAK
jgi:hypothetical protein